MARLVVAPDLFPLPDCSCIVNQGAILPPDPPPWNPGSVRSIARGARNPQEILGSS